MNLNPLFFNKLSKDALPSNLNLPGIGAQSYLFADIINITMEDLPTGNSSQNKNPLELALSCVNNINIVIPVNESLMEELKLIINQSSTRTENKETYHLHDASLTKTDNIINEESLAAFISGINQVINNDANKSILINDNNSLKLTEMQSDIDNGGLTNGYLILDTVEYALQNHSFVKFTLKSAAEKITLQISAVNKNNELVPEKNLINIPDFPARADFNTDIEAVSKADNNSDELNIKQVTEKPAASETIIDKNYNIDIRTGKLHEVKEQFIAPVNDNSKKYQVEIIHAESINTISKSTNGIKIPFILDIKTSKEIGEFLSKYNFEKTDSVIRERTKSELSIVDSSEKVPEKVPEKIISNTANEELNKKNKLVFINKIPLIDGSIESESPEIKRNGSEFLRAIKIESGDKTGNELISAAKIRNVPVDKLSLNELSSESSPNVSGKENKPNSEITLDYKSAKKIELPEYKIEADNTVTKNSSNEPPKSPNVDIPPEVNKEELLFFSKELHADKSNKQGETNKLPTANVVSNDVEKSSSYGSNDTRKENNEDNPPEKMGEAKSNYEKILPDKNKTDDNLIQPRKAEEQIKQSDFSTNSLFDKKAVQANEINFKIVTEARTFTETFKKVKSSEIVTEISKYINTGEKQSITFQLTPKNLGAVKLTVDYIDNALHATIEVENEQVKQTVQSNLDQLKTTLQNNGIQLSNLNVNLNSGEPKANKQHSSKKKNYSGNSESKVEHRGELTGKKNLGYNTYEYLV
ncbi:MAG: flagellar hook-length control protein FliK [Bacteroidota bacterium]